VRLVLIHGRDQDGKDEALLRKTWTDGLEVGLSSAGLGAISEHEVVFPYYGDELAQMVAAAKQGLAHGTAKGGNSGILSDPNYMRLLAEILEGAQEGEISVDVATTKGLQNTALAIRLAQLADKTSFGCRILSLMTEDVILYLTKPGIELQLNAKIQQAIGTEPCVVVAHSLGSIIAYRVLRQLGAQAKVRRFITLGSPLGLETIRKLLSPPAREVPKGVASWVNAFDRKDIVALHPLDTSTWDVRPPIENHGSVTNHMANHHGISGYLDDVLVAHRIHEALNGT